MRRFHSPWPTHVEAIRLDDLAFDAPHPNPTHVPGVTYDPVLRRAVVGSNTDPRTADVGDWILRDADGRTFVLSNAAFRTFYIPGRGGL